MAWQVLSAGLLLVAAACDATPMRWERAGTADAAGDEAECRVAARQEAVRRLPYGDGPPIYGVYKEMSRLQWTQGIDNARHSLEEDLTTACMRDRGFERVRAQLEFLAPANSAIACALSSPVFGGGGSVLR